MTVAGPLSTFLVEWYRSALAEEPLDVIVARLIEHAETMAAVGTPVHLRATFATATDEIVLAVFDSVTEDAVAEVCRRAYCPAQRLTAHVEARFWPTESG
jgi:hypothetical protein